MHKGGARAKLTSEQPLGQQCKYTHMDERGRGREREREEKDVEKVYTFVHKYTHTYAQQESCSREYIDERTDEQMARRPQTLSPFLLDVFYAHRYSGSMGASNEREKRERERVGHLRESDRQRIRSRQHSALARIASRRFFLSDARRRRRRPEDSVRRR